jgi:putative SOS response-associated peptidase YedK
LLQQLSDQPRNPRRARPDREQILRKLIRVASDALPQDGRIGLVCARTSLSKKTLREVAEELEAEWSPEDELLFRPRYNAAPSDTLWILRHGADRRVVGSAVWGYRAKGRPLINVRGENVGAGSFREAFASRRCGIVVDGFFEWVCREAKEEPMT